MGIMKPIAGTLAAGTILAASLAGAVQAQETDASVLAGTCANCHGTDGVSPGSIPSIAGQPYAVLIAQLQAFKAGEVPGATIMTRIASGYTDEELEAIARYFSEIEQ
ncbi:c-type cytochrome [Pelagibacterium montanilacus]|uniref:c-type cytochrome n=1 Tax=Pelagibacterium montanilacus TaxID=2185280 RepID=UPI000F8D81F8|nr:c-type cytochrome [Pelagibacterium montanilacus]